MKGMKNLNDELLGSEIELQGVCMTTLTLCPGASLSNTKLALFPSNREAVQRAHATTIQVLFIFGTRINHSANIAERILHSSCILHRL